MNLNTSLNEGSVIDSSDISVQSPNGGPFVPAGCLDLPSPYIVITIGDDTASLACENGIPAVALSGMRSWPAKRLEVTDVVNRDTTVHANLIEIAKKFGAAIIVGSSEARSNQFLEKALSTFADALRRQAGVPVAYFAVKDPKAKKGKNTDGLDTPGYMNLGDWMQMDFQHVVNSLNFHIAKEKERFSARSNGGGYTALGYGENNENWVWSNERENLSKLTPDAVMKVGQLLTVCGGEWITATYGKEDRRTGEIRVDYQEVAKEIIDACAKMGPFRPEMLRGRGVWPDPYNPEVLIVNGAGNLWRTDGKKQDRVGEYIYAASVTIGVDESTVEATTNEVQELLDVLQTWKFKRQSDARMLMGWMCLAFTCGANKWRPHLSLTGELGAGKSTLVSLVQAILGHASILRDADSTESGLRQEIQSRSCAIILDEAEGDGDKLGRILAFFRSSSSGAIKARGTANHIAASFEMKAMGLLSGIVQPQKKAAEESRFILIELDSVNAEAAGKPGRLIQHDGAEARKLGVCLFKRMLKSWPRFLRANELIRQVVREAGHSPRFIDTMSSAITASWIALNDGELTLPEAIIYTKSFDIEDDADRITGEKEEQLILDYLLMSHISVGGSKMSVATACEYAFGDKKCAFALGEIGLRVDVDENRERRLLLNLRNPKIKELFEKSDWPNGDLDKPLRRLRGVKKFKEQCRIGSNNCKPLSIPLPDLVKQPQPAAATTLSKKMRESLGIDAVADYASKSRDQIYLNKSPRCNN